MFEFVEAFVELVCGVGEVSDLVCEVVDVFGVGHYAVSFFGILRLVISLVGVGQAAASHLVARCLRLLVAVISFGARFPDGVLSQEFCVAPVLVRWGSWSEALAGCLLHSPGSKVTPLVIWGRIVSGVLVTYILDWNGRD